MIWPSDYKTIFKLNSNEHEIYPAHIYYCHKIKHIFYTIPIFEVMKNNLSFGFYSTCTLVFWLPNLDKLD